MIIHFRLARESDCKKVFEWINDPYVRANSFQTEQIPLEDHKKWFFSAISNPNVRYYIAVNLQGESIGQARFSIDGTEATISVLIGRSYRGKHLGINLISRSTDKIFNETPVTNVHAYVKIINNISLNSFTNANYTKIGFIKINGQDAYHLIKTKGMPTHVPAMATSS